MLKKSFTTILVGFFLLSFAACKKMEVRDVDKQMFVRPSDFAEYGFVFQNPEKHETFEKTRLFDGSYQIEHNFETPESEITNPLFLSQTVSVEIKKSDAALSKGAEETGISIGLKIGGIEKEEIKDFFNYGDASSFYVLKKDGRKVGNFFVVREGKKTFSLFIVGIYIDEAETWREIVEPKLKVFSAYTPN